MLFSLFTGRALYAKIASVIPKYREKIRGSQGKSGANSSNKAGKKKKKGKR